MFASGLGDRPDHKTALAPPCGITCGLVIYLGKLSKDRVKKGPAHSKAKRAMIERPLAALADRDESHQLALAHLTVAKHPSRPRRAS